MFQTYIQRNLDCDPLENKDAVSKVTDDVKRPITNYLSDHNFENDATFIIPWAGVTESASGPEVGCSKHPFIFHV